MSEEQQYTPQEETKKEEEDGGIFCPNLSPFVKKLGYYLTFLVGIVVFIVGIISLIEGSVIALIIGSLIVILSPLWIKSPAALCRDLKNPLRLTSCILFFAFLIATIVANILFKDDVFIPLILGICLGAAGIWYFLSYFENGQKACISCLKACCPKKEGEGQEGEAQAGEGQGEGQGETTEQA